jgi:hypothetical protein
LCGGVADGPLRPVQYGGASHNCHAYGLDGAATDLPDGLPVIT